MRKYLLIINIICLSMIGLSQNIWPAFDFKDVNADGDTLYYRITSSVTPYTVAVTRCHDSAYHALPVPSFAWEVGQPGFLYPIYDYDSLVNIPSEVIYDGNAYIVTSIDKEAFYMQKNLHSVILPSTIETIDSGAFQNSSLHNIVLSSNLKEINNCAFLGTPLDSINLPSGLNHIGTQAFEWSSLKNINIPENVKVLPYKVFYGCPLTKITFSEGLQEIQMNAFSANNIDSIIFPASLQKIEQISDEFADSVSCFYIEFLQGNEHLELGNNCFMNFRNLKTVILSDNIFRIGKSCFENTALQQVTLPSSIDTISSRCFSYCSNLENVSLSDNLTSISESAFLETPLLQDIKIPNSVKYIGDKAFRTLYGEGLKTINIFCNVPPVIENTTFNNQDSVVVRVPCGKIPDYTSALGWKNYNNFIYEDCVNVEQYSQLNVKIYPNPTNNYLSIYFSDYNNDLYVKIFDLSGSCVLAQSFQGKATIDLSSLCNGIYIFTIYAGKEIVYREKVVLKR